MSEASKHSAPTKDIRRCPIHGEMYLTKAFDGNGNEQTILECPQCEGVSRGHPKKSQERNRAVEAIKVIHKDGHLQWECPASICGNVRIPVEGPKAWQWNGSLDSPTITPSVKVDWYFGEEPNKQTFCCHCTIADGLVSFCADCTHELAGQTVPMLEVQP